MAFKHGKIIVRVDSLVCRMAMCIPVWAVPGLHIENARVGTDCVSFAVIYWAKP